MIYFHVDIHQLHEINLDKVREWKSFFKSQRYEGLSSQVLTKRKSLNKRNNVVGFEDIMKVGYEVYADGPTRVLRISKASGGHKEDKVSRARGKIRIRVPGLTIHMTELKVCLGSHFVFSFTSSIFFELWLMESVMYIQNI